jgi:hypothetical protein
MQNPYFWPVSEGVIATIIIIVASILIIGYIPEPCIQTTQGGLNLIPYPELNRGLIGIGLGFLGLGLFAIAILSAIVIKRNKSDS